MRRAAKVDTTQREIVETLRAHGCQVRSLASVGQGMPDLLVLRRTSHPAAFGTDLALMRLAYPWQVVLVECKTGTGKLRPEQQQFQAEGWPVVVLRSAEQAREWLGVPGALGRGETS